MGQENHFFPRGVWGGSPNGVRGEAPMGTVGAHMGDWGRSPREGG